MRLVIPYAVALSSILIMPLTSPRAYSFYNLNNNKKNNKGEIIKEIYKEIDEHKIMIYCKSDCCYCTKVKRLFAALDEEPCVKDLDEFPDGAEIQVLHLLPRVLTLTVSRMHFLN